MRLLGSGEASPFLHVDMIWVGGLRRGSEVDLSEESAKAVAGRDNSRGLGVAFGMRL